MIKKVLGIGLLVVGTMIGAGFASGREIISFFGSGISLWVALLCGVAIFGLCALFLWLGSFTRANNVSQLNQKLIGRFHFIPDSFLLVNSLIVLAGMLAGIDSLGNMFFKAAPLYSILMGILCILVVRKGIKGLLNCNGIIVPIIVFALVLVCAITLSQNFVSFDFIPFKIAGLLKIAVYVSMNMMLASTVLTTLGKLNKKEILLSSGIAATIMGALLVALILALNTLNNSLINSSGTLGDMPVLDMAKAINPLLFGLIAIVIAVSIFTTMLTAMSGLCSWFSMVFGNGIYCPIIVLLAGFVVSRLGFNSVVTFLYPVIGVLGLFYILLGIIYAFRNTALSKPLKTLFNKRNGKVHERSHHT